MFTVSANAVRFVDRASEVHGSMSMDGVEIDTQPKLTSLSGSGFYKVEKFEMLGGNTLALGAEGAVFYPGGNEVAPVTCAGWRSAQ